jgi:predicted GIY-YIG superfamily endonuclease
LIERLGEEFFKSAPREPGVYIMRGMASRILYIGQSKNLRSRLAFYKNANPDRIPRRLTRLVHQVETITLERCANAEAARARELELLRLHRPRFNRADTGPQFYHYIETQSTPLDTTVRIHFDPPAHPEEESSWLGPVRGRIIPLQALAALQRLSVCAAQQIRRCSEVPLFPKRLASLSLSRPAFASGLNEFLRGESVELVTQLLESQSRECELALRQLHESDADTLLSWSRSLQEAKTDGRTEGMKP